MSASTQVQTPSSLPFSPSDTHDDKSEDLDLQVKDVFRSKLETMPLYPKMGSVGFGEKMGELSTPSFSSHLMQSSFVKDIEDATRDFPPSFNLPYVSDVSKLNNPVPHFMHHPMNVLFDHSPPLMASPHDSVNDSHHHPSLSSAMSGMPSGLMPSMNKPHFQNLNMLRLGKDLEHKMLPAHDLSQLSMGMPMLFNKLQAPMQSKMNDSIDTHPNMSDLESIRNGLPMMIGVCPPMSGMLKSSMSHMGGMRHGMSAHPVSSWTQGDVLQWLDKIMLGNLRPVFQKHEISGDMLLDLGEEDMKNEMGINSGIVRRKLSRQLELLKEMHDSSQKLDSELGDQSLEDIECDLAQCVVELNQVMHEEGLSQPKVARALGIQSQGHLSELLRGKYKHSRNSSAQHWAKEIRSFLSLTPKERQDAINIFGQSQCAKKRKSSKRTVWSKEQNMMLENFFRQKPSPTKPERQLLASQCCVEVGVINTYFQNKRRRSRHLQPM